VVASTDVYADIARAVAGDRVEVSAVIDSPAKDPHEYEASGRDLLSVSRADVVVRNGGGYDTFLDPLLKDAPDAVVITAVDLVRHAGANEHVWYDLDTAAAVAFRVEAELARLDPTGAPGYEKRLAAFTSGIGELRARADAVRQIADGRAALVPEPVPLYLLAALGLTDRTPTELSESVEEGTDVAPGVLLAVLATVQSREISLLAYNEQTATGQTDRIRDAAEAAGVPVVDFAETLPNGTTYLAWMGGNIDRVAAALKGPAS
jgi:zinc/manganese transport system substrate-binding protein